MKRALPYLLAILCVLVRDAGAAPAAVGAAAALLAGLTFALDSALRAGATRISQHEGAARISAGVAWLLWTAAPFSFALDCFRQADEELTILTPVVVGALVLVIIAASWAFERFGVWTRRSRAHLALVGLPHLLLFAWLTESSGTLLSVRPGTQLEHLALFAGSWGLALLSAAIEAQAQAADGERQAPPLWVGAIALLLGLGILEADHRVLVDQYAALHMWMFIQGFVLLRIGVEGLIGERADAPPLVAKVALGLVVFGALAGAAQLSRYTQLEQRNGLDRSAVGRSVLLLVPPAAAAPPDGIAGLHPALNYPRFLDEAPPLDKPNILLISVDALRGDIYEHAPALAAFADRATRFDTAYAQGSRTAIGMGTLLTGRYSANIDWDLWVYKRGNILPRDELTPAQIKKWKRKYVHTTIPRIPAGGMLAERIQAQGYATTAVPFAGHNQFFREGVGFDRGFDTFVDLTKSEWKTPSSAKISERVIKELERLEAGDAPWLMWTHYYDPHESHGKMPRYEQLIGDFDRGFAQLIAHLEASGQLEHTIVAVVADHGEALGEHGHGSHATSVYDEQTRVPLVLWVPGMEPSRVQEPVAAIDLSATLAVLAGADTQDFDGTNLLPLARGEAAAKQPRPVFTELHRYLSSKGKRTSDLKALRLGDWKLIQDRKKGTLSLYNIAKDPDEMDDQLSAEPEVADELQAILAAFLAAAETAHPLP